MTVGPLDTYCPHSQKTMSKRPRQKPSRPAHHQSQPGARYAAGSSPWVDLDTRGPPGQAAAIGPRPKRRRISHATSTSNTPHRFTKPPSVASIFGPWGVGSSQPQKRLQEAKTCALRSERREVLFATRSTGKGASTPKRKFTNRSCK